MTVVPRPLFIDTPTELERFCRALKGAKWLAVDTEFLRERTYFPVFCLLQVASSDVVACIDPLTLPTLRPILEILYDRTVTKVFHAARQDLEIFYHLHGELPQPVFDTQIAAPLLGLAEQIGYATLVAELLGIHLSKGHTRTDWSVRPLSQEQIRYAAEDVVFLGAVYQKMRKRLEMLRRLEWLNADLQALVDPRHYEHPPETAWQRVTGAHQLNPQQLTVLQGLAAWRDTAARSENLPRGWLLKDEVLIDLARLQPEDAETLKSLRGMDHRIVKRYGETLCRVILDYRQRPPLKTEKKPRPSRKTADQEAVLDVLSAVLRLRSAQHALNPSVVASRKDLEALMEHRADCPLLKDWRADLVGTDLAALLRGERRLTVVEGKLRIESSG